MSGFLSSSDLVNNSDRGESPGQAQLTQSNGSVCEGASNQPTQCDQTVPSGQPAQPIAEGSPDVSARFAQPIAEGAPGIPGQPSFDPRNLRTGLGMDVHAFAPGRPLIIGGVRVPHYQGLDGHSDADVLAHAVMDALLSAARAGDIGKLFPPSDPAFKNADSIKLLENVAAHVRSMGFEIIDVDSVIAAQEPKLSPHREAMRANLAAAMGVPVDNVGVKATTTERLGYEGREEGITAYATCLLHRCR